MMLSVKYKYFTVVLKNIFLSFLFEKIVVTDNPKFLYIVNATTKMLQFPFEFRTAVIYYNLLN